MIEVTNKRLSRLADSGLFSGLLALLLLLTAASNVWVGCDDAFEGVLTAADDDDDDDDDEEDGEDREDGDGSEAAEQDGGVLGSWLRAAGTGAAAGLTAAVAEMNEADLRALGDRLVSLGSAAQLRALDSLEPIGARAQAAVPGIIALLAVASDEVRTAAASAIGSIGLDTLPATVQGEALAALQTIGSLSLPALPAIVPLLAGELRDTAAATIASFGPDVLDPLGQQLAAASGDLRRGIVYAFGQLDPSVATAAVPVLIGQLVDTAPDLQLLAIQGLVTYGPAAAEALPALQDLVTSGSADVAQAAQAAVVAIGGAD